MTLSALDYANRVRDPRWERPLAQALRTMSETDRFQFLTELLPVQFTVALNLAHGCLTERQSFESLLDQGLAQADASVIRYWLACALPRLGFRRGVRFLRRRLSVYPRGVEMALYWLPAFSHLPGYAKAELDALREDVSAASRHNPPPIDPEPAPGV